ncbi:hypothetical protein PIB30_045582 [Stylosanthes scabra]|uniref:Uncharacterized protein n=1 Tax=Stylosanthes scabra TaxID=79078 RepID=A0ABU6ZEZ3_9FABA|nr:hypothetical protein [Stylosanthes scabra]
MENDGSISSVASWFGSTVSSAFFSSLERFSCVNVSTSDPDEDDDFDDFSSVATPTSATTSPTAATNTALNPPSDKVNGPKSNDVANLPDLNMCVFESLENREFLIDYGMDYGSNAQLLSILLQEVERCMNMVAASETCKFQVEILEAASPFARKWKGCSGE